MSDNEELRERWADLRVEGATVSEVVDAVKKVYNSNDEARAERDEAWRL